MLWQARKRCDTYYRGYGLEEFPTFKAHDVAIRMCDVATLVASCRKRKREDTITLSGTTMAKARANSDNRLGHRVRLRDLHVLTEVVRWRGMAKAAPHLAMSQAAVSEAIASLERALGVKLLERSARGIAPTIYADALLKRGHVVFDELRQGIRDIEFLADPTVGEVRVACAEMPAAGLVPAAIDLLACQNPRIVVRVFRRRRSTPPALNFTNCASAKSILS